MMKKKIIALLMAMSLTACYLPLRQAAFLPVSAAASAKDFTIKNGVLQDYTGSETKVVIPDGVTKIGPYAFAFSGVKTVSIPEGVTLIDNDAFAFCTALYQVAWPASLRGINTEAFLGCTSLCSAALPDGVTTIGADAFHGCWSLETVTLPKNLKNIYSWAFAECYRLKAVTVPAGVEVISQNAFYGVGKVYVNAGNASFSSQNGNLFDKKKTTLIYAPNAGESYTVPSTVTTIQANAFLHSGVKEVTLPPSVTAIGQAAFEDPLKTVHFTGSRQQWNDLLADGTHSDNPQLRKASVTCGSELVLTRQPANAAAAKGGKVSFTVSAKGDGMTYQWQLSDTEGKKWYNSTVTKNTYYATIADNNNGRWLRCIVTDKDGYRAVSKPAVMRISDLTITQQPTDALGYKGGKVQFTVAAKGDGVAYQWQLSDNQGKTWYHSSVKTNTYYATMADNNNGRMVRCIVTDKYGAKLTSRAAVMRYAAVKITGEPSDATGKVNEKVTFTVKASGENLAYQWYYKKSGDASWTEWKNQTRASASLTMYKSWNNAQVRCKVTGGNGESVMSLPAKLRLYANPVITDQPDDAFGQVGDTVTFRTAATGKDIAYQWYYKKAGQSDWTKWKNQTGTAVSLTLYKSWDGAQFYCEMTDAYGETLRSDTVSLKVFVPVTVTSQPKDVTAAKGDKVTFTVGLTGQNYTCQWLKQPADNENVWMTLYNTDSPTLTVTAEESALYVCEIYSSDAVIRTEPARLTVK